MFSVRKVDNQTQRQLHRLISLYPTSQTNRMSKCNLLKNYISDKTHESSLYIYSYCMNK